MKKIENYKRKLRDGHNGVTLVALIITIIVLLILAGITINTLTSGGLFKRVDLAALEVRGSSVQEARDLWYYDKEMGKYNTEVTAKSVDEVVDELAEQGLLNPEEVNRIKNGDGKVEIGSRSGNKAIIFRTGTIYGIVDIKNPNFVKTSLVQSVLVEVYDGATRVAYTRTDDIGGFEIEGLDISKTYTIEFSNPDNALVKYTHSGALGNGDVGTILLVVGDFNNDGISNILDVNLLNDHLNTIATAETEKYDLNGDGLINDSDSSLLYSNQFNT